MHANFELTCKRTDRPMRLHTETLLLDVLRYVAPRPDGPLRGWRQTDGRLTCYPGSWNEVWVSLYIYIYIVIMYVYIKSSVRAPTPTNIYAHMHAVITTYTGAYTYMYIRAYMHADT